MIYPVDSVIYLLDNWDLVLNVRLTDCVNFTTSPLLSATD